MARRGKSRSEFRRMQRAKTAQRRGSGGDAQVKKEGTQPTASGEAAEIRKAIEELVAQGMSVGEAKRKLRRRRSRGKGK